MPHLPDYDLRFTHPQLADIQVTMGRLSIDEVFELNLILAMPLMVDGRVDAKAVHERSTALREFIGPRIVEWNLTDRAGDPVKPGTEGLTDPLLVTGIMTGWLEGLGGGEAPLEQTPAADIEASIPMEPL
jgi:hypothetical protein